MLIKVAWRNIWRSKTRSFVVTVAVALGLWAGLFVAAFMYGVSEQRLISVIDSQTSHVQIHYPGFTENYDIQLSMNDADAILETIRQDPNTKGVSGRLISTGMIASATTGSGVFIKGLIPEDESSVTSINNKIIDGAYFEGVKRNPIVIGKKLADKLGVKIRSKVVISTQDKMGNITSGAFRIAGIFLTNSSRYDEANVFAKYEDLSSFLGTENEVHEIAVLLNNEATVDAFALNLISQLDTNKHHVETWKELLPELYYLNELMDEYLKIFMSIILLAMAFGIINTMLMAVLERVKELGMLMAVGMNKSKVFTMIVIETIFLTFSGTPAGILLGILSTRYLNKTGVDLSIFSKGLANFELDAVLYPSLNNSFYPELIILVMVTAILSSIYPAYKAISLKPAEAIRSL